uniref:kelch repeat and BTB domain-containing protein F47D12.7-like n=1 Tax=Erigeron canadensis TaxID=72917 RepID=UPI001CB92BB0|nr:kelch repeat and BTB domain-containing protein F47D12.7-like [Erigeron canadensis]
MGSDHGPSSIRGLGKSQLGGVIFGTNKMTINECLHKQLFGLPKPHMVYVKRIEPGLPLFLFNYTDRTLLGIFEAASSGQENLDPYAWTCAGSQKTPFPAQVQICEKLKCKALTENQFKPIIADNYHTLSHFWFELDHAQTNRLLSLLSSQVLSGPRATVAPHSTIKKTTLLPLAKERMYQNPTEVVGNHLSGAKSLPSNIRDVKTSNALNEKDIVKMQLMELALKRKLVSPSTPSDKLVGPHCADHKVESAIVNNKTVENNKDDPANPTKDHFVIAQLIEKVEDLTAATVKQNDKIKHLEQLVASLEKNLAEAKNEIKNLKGVCNAPELQTSVGTQKVDDIEEKDIFPDGLPDDAILLVGGYDGASWLSTLDCYSPLQNLNKSLNPMNNERSHAAVSKLDGELYVFGGGTRGQWFDTVESYNPVANQWTTCPPLNQKKGSLAGATVNDKIYAFGGGIDTDCYATVEMLDFDIGAWIPARSMLEKRFSLAAAELNGAIYAVGGYDGKNYLRTAERFDPREHSWKKIESMNTLRGCPSMAVLDEKLFILGGYDGSELVSTVEIYDPRRGSWMIGEPMNIPRGFSAAAVTKDCIYVFGGLKNGEEINDTVEFYKEGQGWKMVQTNNACRRCFFSAVAL